jgi:hypothetical protein
MMNCMSSIPGRYDPQIFDTHDIDDDSVQEFYRAHPCTLEKKKARQMESVLENAITMAENSSGRLFCLQEMSKLNAIELGRHISTCQSIKLYEAEQDLTVDELPSSRSFQNAVSFPTFLKLELGFPEILTQKSMDTISLADAESESEEENCGVQSKTKVAPVVVTPPRSLYWNKLRKTLSTEERVAKQLERQKSKLGSDRLSHGRKNLMSRQKSVSLQNCAKNSATERSLKSEKKRGWGRPVRRNNTKESKEHKKTTDALHNPVREDLPLTPALNPRDISKDSGVEDFFLNERTSADDVGMVVVEQKSSDEEPVIVEESMEVVSQGSCFDIIGASNILKGLETSWKELNEDNFDVVPRRH